MGLVKTVLVTSEFLEQVHESSLDSTNAILKLQSELNKTHALVKKFYRKNAKLKLIVKRLARQRRSRIRPRPALKLFMQMHKVLKFQAEQIRSLAKYAFKKEQFAHELWSKIRG